MARVASEKSEYKNLKDEHVDSIVQVLKGFQYSDKEMMDNVYPHLAQWLHDNNVAIESTCVIISSVVDINPIQDVIDEIYNPDTIQMPFSLSDLQKYLSDDEFNKLRDVVEIKELKDIITFPSGDNSFFRINFNDKVIEHVVEKRTKNKGLKYDVTPVYNAVPSELIVYDSDAIDGRLFKSTWESKTSYRKWHIAGEGGGTTVKDVATRLINSGYCINPKYAEPAITGTINAMLEEHMAIVKTEIDNRGIYYNIDTGKVTVVDIDYTEPTNKEKAEALGVLEQVHGFYDDNEAVFATCFKWGLMSVFYYAMKTVGNRMNWLFLKGTSQAGKTTLGEILIYIYDIPDEDVNNLGGSQFDSPYKIGINVSQEALMRIINEPIGVFDSKNNVETIKNCVWSTTARSKQLNGTYRQVSAFSPVCFTTNGGVPDDEALINRFYIMSFYRHHRKTTEQKEAFKKAFKKDIPSQSPLKKLNMFGRFAICEIIKEPALLEEDWMKAADTIIGKFYESINTDVPEWLQSWEPSESIYEFDETIREDIRSFFLDEINSVRRRGLIRDEYGKVKSTLDMPDESSSIDFEGDVWDMINTNVFNWCLPHVTREGDKEVCLTQSFRKELKKNINYSDNLQSIGEVLHWKHKPVKFGNGSVKRCIVVLLENFVDFVYPRVVDDEN